LPLLIQRAAAAVLIESQQLGYLHQLLTEYYTAQIDLGAGQGNWFVLHGIVTFEVVRGGPRYFRNLETVIICS
jgi:hypothetical protein